MQNRPALKIVAAVAPLPLRRRGLCTVERITAPSSAHAVAALDQQIARILSKPARWRVCDGLSPNASRYSTENRPSSTKPKDIAISVTVAELASADSSVPLARDSRDSRRCRHGGSPWIL